MVLNGQPVPVHPDAGVCYRCGGTGVDPTITKQMVDKSNKEYVMQLAQHIFKEDDKRRFFRTFVYIHWCEEHPTYLSIKDKDALNRLINAKFVEKYKDGSRTYVKTTELGRSRLKAVMDSFHDEMYKFYEEDK
jgi:hypothetical protein